MKIEGIKKDFSAISSALGISKERVEKIFADSQLRTNLINYLAEIAETSPEEVEKTLDNSGLGEYPLDKFVEYISNYLKKASIEEIYNAMCDAIEPKVFTMHLSSESGRDIGEVENILEKSIFEKLVVKNRLTTLTDFTQKPFLNRPSIKFTKNSEGQKFAKGKIQFVGFGCPEKKVDPDRLKLLERWLSLILKELKSSPPAIFQDGIIDYHNRFYKGPMPENEFNILSEQVKNKYGTILAEIIDIFILERFGTKSKIPNQKRNLIDIKKAKEKIKYVVTFGIGGNEMRWHTLSEINNSNPHSKAKWIPINFAGDIDLIPADANSKNTIQLAFSRSGDTEETKGSIEVLGRRFPNTIVFANKGELKEAGEKMGALILPFPPKIAGRYCGLKTPVNLAPMSILGMDTKKYWETSEQSAKAFLPESKTNLAWEISAFIFREKILTGTKMIYLGQNHPLLKKSLDEVNQFIMEGLAKEGNEIFSMVGMKYPRNSHYEIEGPLGNPNFWLFWNVIFTGIRIGNQCDYLRYGNASDPQKSKLFADEILMTLIAGNLNTFAKRSPSIIILIPELDLETFALLSKIYEDTIYYLCKMCCVDPFGNPAVKNVRFESAENVKKLYHLKKQKIKGKEILYRLIKENYS